MEWDRERRGGTGGGGGQGRGGRRAGRGRRREREGEISPPRSFLKVGAYMPSEKVNDPVSRPTRSTVGMARHYGPRSWIPRNSGPSRSRVVGARPRRVTLVWCVHTKARVEAASDASETARQRCLQVPSYQRRWQLDCEGDTAGRRTRYITVIFLYSVLVESPVLSCRFKWRMSLTSLLCLRLPLLKSELTFLNVGPTPFCSMSGKINRLW